MPMLSSAAVNALVNPGSSVITNCENQSQYSLSRSLCSCKLMIVSCPLALSQFGCSVCLSNILDLSIWADSGRGARREEEGRGGNDGLMRRDR